MMNVMFRGVVQRTFIAAVFYGLAVAGFQGTLRAQAGQLDPTFGAGGKVDITLVTGPDASNGAVTVQANGQIVLAGTVQPTNSPFSGGLVRYNSNGSLDSSFGTGGVAINDFPSSFASQNFGVAILPDGKIVTGGAVYPQGIGVARFNADGTPDASFGIGGTATASSQIPTVGALVVLPDGKILVAGDSIARFNPDGSLDTGFGTGGVAQLADVANAMAVQSNGRILIGGRETIARYNTNGTLDTTFGIFGRAGIVTPVAALAVQSNGQIVALGTLVAPLIPPNALPGAFLVTRYNSNGTVDRTFGTRGGTLVNFFAPPTNAAGFALAIQPNGEIVAAGQAASGSANSQFAVARLTSTGVLDSTFGNGGVVTTSFGKIDSAFAVALQSNGDIVAAGIDETATTSSFALARYLGQ